MTKLLREFFVRGLDRIRAKPLTETEIIEGQLMHHLRPKGQLADGFAAGVKWAESKHGISPRYIKPAKCLHFWEMPGRVKCLKCGVPYPEPSDHELLSQKEKNDNQSKS